MLNSCKQNNRILLMFFFEYLYTSRFYLNMKGYICIFIVILLMHVNRIYSECTSSILIVPALPKEQENFTLSCSMFNCGTISSIIWEKCSIWSEPVCQVVGEYQVDTKFFDAYELDGYTLVGRSGGDHGEFPPVFTHNLQIYNSKAEDDGEWTCKHGSESGKRNLTVEVPPVISDLTPDGKFLISNISMNLQAKISRVNPLATMKFIIGGIEYENSTDTHKRNGPVYEITSDLSVPFYTVEDIDVQVLSYRENGFEWVGSTPKAYTIVASSRIESPTSAELLEPKINDDTFTLSCIASGYERSINWIKNNSDIGDLFNTLDPVEVSDGDYPYDQAKALKSSMVWNKPEGKACDEAIKHNGEYWCEAEVNVEGLLSKEVSPRYTVDVKYGPIINMDTTIEVEKASTFNLTCKVCANPPPHTYLWQYDGSDLPNGVIDFGNGVVQINTVDCEQCGVYTCTAINAISEATFTLNVEPKVSGLSVGAIIGIVIGVLVVCGIIGFGLFVFISKKKKKKADEEVVAYAESGDRTETAPKDTSNTTANQNTTAAPVYSEVNKNKKEKSSNAKGKPPPVYAEVDKTKKKSESTTAEKHTGTVYSQVNKPDHRPLPQLKPKSSTGSTNTGPVYTEVNKSKQGRLTPIEGQHYDNAVQRNEHGGLHYADVDFLRQGHSGTKQTHRTKNPSYEPTEYAQIDHRKSAGIVV